MGRLLRETKSRWLAPVTGLKELLVMNAVINSIADACNFIKRWANRTENLAGPDLPHIPLPDEVRQLSHGLGTIWASKSMPADEPLAHLFSGQDQIFPPWSYKPQGGVIALMDENEGGWRLGYRPTASNQLLIIGDLPVDLEPRPVVIEVSEGFSFDWSCKKEKPVENDHESIGREIEGFESEFDKWLNKIDQHMSRGDRRQWRTAKVQLDQMMICVLLQNLLLSQDELSYQGDWPSDATKPLFRFSPYGGRGFWTNSNETMIAYESVEFFVARKG